GHLVHLTLTISEALTVTGTPTLLLNDGGTASYNSALSNPPTGSFVFAYTVVFGQNTPEFAVSSVNNLARVQYLTGNNVNLTGHPTNPAGTLQIDTIAPTFSTIAPSATSIVFPTRRSSDLGHLVHLTLTISEALTVTGTPTLSLNDGGTASYN